MKYYSEKLKKVYDTVEQLQAAEVETKASTHPDSGKTTIVLRFCQYVRVWALTQIPARP